MCIVIDECGVVVIVLLGDIVFGDGLDEVFVWSDVVLLVILLVEVDFDWFVVLFNGLDVVMLLCGSGM